MTTEREDADRMDHGFLGIEAPKVGPEAGVYQDRTQAAGALWLSLALHFAAGEGTNGSTAEAGGGVAMAEGGSMAMAVRHHGCERGSMAEGEDP